jgi:drug/metabolite transporter (DMT)-like permease
MRSYLLLLLCVTLWGCNFVFGSILVKHFPPLHLSAFRLGTTTLFLCAYAAATRRFTRLTARDILYMLPLAVVGYLMNQVAFFTGLQTTGATTAALILSLSPICTALLARLFLKEPFTLRMAIGSVIALAGVFFVVGNGSGLHISVGIWLMVVAMATFSVSVILMRKLTESLDAFAATVYSTILGFGFILPTALWREPHAPLHAPWWSWLLLIGTALVIQGICSLIWNGQLRQVGAAKASIFLNLQPFVAMILGFLLIGTPITLIQTVGSALIVGGVVFATWQGLPAPRSVSLPEK